MAKKTKVKVESDDNVAVREDEQTVTLPICVEAAMKSINKTYGDGSIIRVGDSKCKMVLKDRIPTGCMSIDMLVGAISRIYDDDNEVIGYSHGLPTGRICEIFGGDGSGKTTLCDHIVASAQELGKRCAYIDMEHTLDLEYASNLGVNVDELFFAQPSSGEEALDIVHSLLETNGFGVIIVDSVASLVPKDELEKGIGDDTIGLQARLMSKFFRKNNTLIGNSNTLLVFTNQIRSKIGGFGGSTTSGGRALRFYASLRINLIQSSKILDNSSGEQIGQLTIIIGEKNKISRPKVKVTCPLIYGLGFDYHRDLIEKAVEFNVISRRGSWYVLDDESIGQGADNVALLLKTEPELTDKITNRVFEEYMRQQDEKIGIERA
jgi:recombination protein RecA